MKKPQCSKCGRALSDPFSIAVGMGPECRGGLSKKGWKFPKPQYRVRKGRVELVGMVGKLEPPAGDTTVTVKKSKYRRHPAYAKGQYDHAEGRPRRHNPYAGQGDQTDTLAWWAGWDNAEVEDPKWSDQ